MQATTKDIAHAMELGKVLARVELALELLVGAIADGLPPGMGPSFAATLRELADRCETPEEAPPTIDWRELAVTRRGEA